MLTLVFIIHAIYEMVSQIHIHSTLTTLKRSFNKLEMEEKLNVWRQKGKVRENSMKVISSFSTQQLNWKIPAKE